MFLVVFAASTGKNPLNYTPNMFCHTLSSSLLTNLKQYKVMIGNLNKPASLQKNKGRP
jgi:hypothetical protein